MHKHSVTCVGFTQAHRETDRHANTQCIAHNVHLEGNIKYACILATYRFTYNKFFILATI